jgi:hypothetical protein
MILNACYIWNFQICYPKACLYSNPPKKYFAVYGLDYGRNGARRTVLSTRFSKGIFLESSEHGKLTFYVNNTAVHVVYFWFKKNLTLTETVVDGYV